MSRPCVQGRGLGGGWDQLIWLLTSKNINPKIESSFMQREGAFENSKELPLDKLILQKIIFFSFL